MTETFDDQPIFLLNLSADEARAYFCRTSSYFDMELPPYFNFRPILESVLHDAEQLSVEKIKKWKPYEFDRLNYTLLYNKDGDIAWRPFELFHPLIYAKLIDVITSPDNWNFIQERFRGFSNGIVECCSIPVVDTSDQPKAKKAQILNWWKSIEQRSIELSLEYSHISLTDVSNCYPSIYTHSIAWALHDRATAKADRKLGNLLGNKIDKLVSWSREGQTNGIPQASLVSHLLAELVLGYCDTIINESLENSGDMTILRYRDDFRVFANSDTECAIALKKISEALNIFGMKLGAAKTQKAANVVLGAVKQDKIDALSLARRQTTLQKELLIIHRFCTHNSGSGAAKFLIRDFTTRLERKLPSKSWKIENPIILTAILLDISSKNPAVFPAVATAISKIMLYLSDSKRDELFTLARKKTARMPNNGYMQLWMQRIAHPNHLDFTGSEKMCQLVDDSDSGSIWNNEWIKDTALRERIENFSVIDRVDLDEISPDIQFEEFDQFWKGYN